MNRKLAIDLLEKYGSVILICNGNSMKPIMQPKDKLHIKKVPSNKLRKDDIVFCKINGNLQVHKLTSIQNNKYEISNNHGFVNGWIGQNNIYGLCVQVQDRILINEQMLQER